MKMKMENTKILIKILKKHYNSISMILNNTASYRKKINFKPFQSKYKI